MKPFLLFVFSLLSFSMFAQTPCSTEKHSEFHFWVGEWTVTQNGNPAGTNSIMLDQGTCLMVERWTSATPPYTGTSYNHYDRVKQQWVQLWVDNSGGSLHLTGGMEDGKMVLRSETTKDQQGRDVINKVTWTPHEDGTVQQLWQLSFDEGENWNTVFDGLYVRKTEN